MDSKEAHLQEMMDDVAKKMNDLRSVLETIRNKVYQMYHSYYGTMKALESIIQPDNLEFQVPPCPQDSKRDNIRSKVYEIEKLVINHSLEYFSTMEKLEMIDRCGKIY